MRSLRLWILVSSATWFLTGLAVGHFLGSEAAHRTSGEPRALAAYEERFLRAFELDARRAELFHGLLENYSRDIERVKEQHMSDQLSKMEPELQRLGQRYDDLIRNRVLPPEARGEFDRLTLAIP